MTRRPTQSLDPDGAAPTASWVALPVDVATEARTTLGQVLEYLGPGFADVVAAPRGLDVPVGEPTIHDGVEQSTIEADAIVLAVGVATDSSEARRLVAEAGTRGAAVVVFKAHGHPFDDVAAEAQSQGVAALVIPDQMAWSHLHLLLERALRVARPAAVPGLAGVPVGDLFALANAIAAMVGGAVTIEDQGARVLAYSSIEGHGLDDARRDSILGRQVPNTPGVRSTYRQLYATDGVIRVDSVEGLEILPRLAVAVRAGGAVLGSIWVVRGGGDDPLAHDAEPALAEAARITALHMIHANASWEIERRMRGEMLRSLLEGRGSIESAAARLGIEPMATLAVLAFELLTSDRAQEELLRERLVDLVALYCETYRHRASCVATGRVVYALVPRDDPMSEERLIAFAREILDHAEAALRTPLRGAVGSTAAGLHDVARSRQEADRVLRVLAADARPRKVASIDQVRSQVVLLELRELVSMHPQLMAGKLQQIETHDAVHRTDYLRTLQAYLDAFGDIGTSAAALAVHPNTFRYRLRRVFDIFDLNLDDPDERLVAALQLRLRASRLPAEGDSGSGPPGQEP